MICCVSHKHSISKQQGKRFYIKHEIYQMIKVFTFILFSLSHAYYTKDLDFKITAIWYELWSVTI